MGRFNAAITLLLVAGAPAGGQQIINGSRTLLGNWDASGAATTKPVKSGTTIPATCGPGEMFFKTDATPGANLYLCTAANTWTQVQGSTGAGTVTNSGGALTLDMPLFGAGGNDSKVGTKTGSGDQVVVSQSPTIVSPVIADFTGMPHNHSNAAGGGQLGLSALAASNLSGNGSKLGTVSGSLTSGDCAKFDAGGNIVDSGAACGGGGGGAVASVFGRTGSITAQNGDYTFSQISGTVATAQLPASVQYFQSGAGAPSSTCTAGQNAYLDTANLDYWFCDVANTWKKVLSTSNSGPFALTGQTGTAPATPSSGFETIYLNSGDKTLHTVSDGGTDMRYAGLGEANTWGAFLQDFSASTIRLPVAAGFTATVNGSVGYDSTGNLLHTSINGSDSIIPTSATTAPPNGDCVKWGSNFQLQDNGSACGGSPAGSNTQLQYNNSGSFGGVTGATTDGTKVTLTNPSLGNAGAPSALTQSYTNDGTTGTGTNLLAKISAANTVVKAATTDADGEIGICVSGCGTTGSAQIAIAGTAACVFDNATTAGHWVQISTGTAGDCHDAGGSLPAAGGQIIGRVLGGGAAGTYNVALQIRTPAGSTSTAPSTLAWLPWGSGYGNSATSGAPVASTANYAISQSFFVPYPVSIADLDIAVGVASGTGCTGGTCGLVFGIYTSDLTSLLCLTAVGTSGGSPNINTTGIKSFTFTGGANVSGGLCSLNPGHYILISTSDSTALRVVNYMDNGQSAGKLLANNTPRYWGVSTAAVSTGDGSSLTLASDIHTSPFNSGSTTLIVGFEK